MIVQQVYDQDPRVIRYTKALINHGAQVDVLSVQGKEKIDCHRGNGLNVYTIPLSHTSQSLPAYLFEYFLAMLFFSFKLFFLHIKNHYDIIHVHNMPDFLIFSALIPRILGAKLILDIHDPMPEFYQAKFKKSAKHPLVPIMTLQEKISASLAHAVLTANPTFKENLIQRGIPAEKITVTQNLPDKNIFERGKFKRERDSAERFTLLYPGTIAPRYGLDTAVRSLLLLIPVIPGIRLRIIGKDNNHTQQLKKLAAELNVGTYVEFIPRLPTEKIPQEMSQADIGIYPALPDPHMSIAMPGKVLEFATMGLPTITSRLQVLEKVFSDMAVRYVSPGQPEEFAQAVLDLYQHPEKLAALIQHADQEFVQIQSWEHERQKYFDVIAKLLNKEQPFQTQP
jgi:glycosyltransferase involved in cell wall biosynthesis